MLVLSSQDCVSVRLDLTYPFFGSLPFLPWSLLALKLWLPLARVGMAWKLLFLLSQESWQLPGENLLPL